MKARRKREYTLPVIKVCLITIKTLIQVLFNLFRHNSGSFIQDHKLPEYISAVLICLLICMGSTVPWEGLESEMVQVSTQK